MRAIFPILVLAAFFAEEAVAADKRIVFGEEKLSIILPDGWVKSDLNKEREQVIAGYASSDNSTSVYFVSFHGGNSSMQDILDATVENYGKQFELSNESDSKSGQIQGPGDKKWPAIFVTLEGDLDAKPKPFEMKFYLMIFDVGDEMILIQATTTRPVWDVRERQIMDLIRSVIART